MSLGRAGLIRPIRPLVVMAAVSLALLVGAQSAFAADVVSKSGKRGSWALKDSMAEPGAFCTYGIDGDPLDGQLDRLEAKSPRVKARNRSASRDSQWVGIRVLFQKSKGDGGTGGWQTVKSTGFVKKLAYDDQAVKIGKRAWPASYTGTPQFRVRANIRWYLPGSKSVVQGALTLAYHWYKGGGGSGTTVGYENVCLPE